MKNILIIGIGGTGSRAVDIFFQKKNELGNQAGNNITALVFDTDKGDIAKISAATAVPMSDNASVGTICDRIGREALREWFPCDDKAVRAQELVRGASQWRKKSYLAFLNLMHKPQARTKFISALEAMSVDPTSPCEVYVVASVAGGTGSGSFIPIALYVKRYLKKVLGKDPIVNAMIALPDIYADSQTPENSVKVYANAYAILRELNAINLVARNYNAGVAEHKKAPIKLKIGDACEPNVGLLFDASDKRFWTPEAAPFSQVFLLDRIPCLNSVAAHDIVLANSLYTILCTEIGSAFDSEFSNHELIRSQNNGSNAIYAGISTSQIRFPKESVLDYLAHRRTLESCNNEWMILHNAVESTIREKEQRCKALKQHYIMRDGEYAQLVINEIERLESENNDSIVSILERDVYEYGEDGKKRTESPCSTFVNQIDDYISAKITKKENIYTAIETKIREILPEKGKVDKQEIPSCAQELGKKLLSYYKQCLDDIKCFAGSTADSIINLDKKKEGFVGVEYSIFDRLLKRDDKFVHPVAAMVQLCYFRKELGVVLAENDTEEWADLRQRNVTRIANNLLKVVDSSQENGQTENNDSQNINGIAAKGDKSAYKRMGEKRFQTIIDPNNSQAYDSISRTDTRSDLIFVWNDAHNTAYKIYTGAQKQLRYKVYTAVAERVDLLIAKYRNFFNRFEKEKEDLADMTKTALRKDAGNVDSVINVYSSSDDKDKIYKEIVDDAGPVTDSDLIATDDIVGRGVFATVYNAAVCELSQDNSWNENDSHVYRTLFSDMIDAYRESIRKSEAFAEIAVCNVIEAMVAKCGARATKKQLEDVFSLNFSVAREIAKPSLRLDEISDEDDVVKPSDVIMVYMMSAGTGKYLKKHADEFGLSVPADEAKEEDVIKACAEAFIHRHSGDASARVEIVSDMPDQVLYCTGEIMDITPLRIAKFNELGSDNVYFKNYTDAIDRFKKYGTDMWNPHLGNNLHKRGYLPYMNEKMEKECDVRVIKALLYGFQKGYILYRDGIGEASGKFFFSCLGKKIADSDGRWINSKNVAQLVAWMRNEEERVDEWSREFDLFVKRQMEMLPNLASDSPAEFIKLESAITITPFMKMLTDGLYIDESIGQSGDKKAKKKGDCEGVKDNSPTAIEFAYMVKTSEEINRDCDDAERILEVLYSTFKMMCEYRTNPEERPERFIQVYKHHLGNVYESIAKKAVSESGDCCMDYFTQIVAWMNDADVFNTVSENNPLDKGGVVIDAPFDANRDSGVKAILRSATNE